MSLPQIRDEWRVPARYGQRVACTILGKHHEGVLTDCDGDRVWVQLDGGEAQYLFHPRDLTYLKGRP